MDVRTMPGYVDGFRPTLGLRELGGWKTVDGRTVKRGLFYRGSAPFDLSQAERELFDGLGLRFILDLRSEGECIDRADYVPSGATYARVGGMYDAHGDEVDFSPMGIARIEKQIQQDPAGFMLGLYTSMMLKSPAVRTMVDRLCEGELPLYFHCTAGKDRTGVCAAVLLSLLGVSDEDIMQEFLLTNEYRASIISSPPARMPDGYTFVSPEEWAKMNGVSEENLRGAFEAVDQRFGSREAYFAQALGIDAQQLQELRKRYLV